MPNLYGFCEGNPVNESDPDGWDPFLVHATDKKGHYTGSTYIMDVPHVYNTPSSNMTTITSNFGARVDRFPKPLRYSAALNIFYQENRNGLIHDFKVTKPAPPLSNSPKSTYHLRAIGGNFLFGEEAARAGWTLQQALDAGNQFRAGGSIRNNPFKVLKDYFHGDKRALEGELVHPADEQQAIQDGFNHWLKQNNQHP